MAMNKCYHFILKFDVIFCSGIWQPSEQQRSEIIMSHHHHPFVLDRSGKQLKNSTWFSQFPRRIETQNFCSSRSCSVDYLHLRASSWSPAWHQTNRRNTREGSLLVGGRSSDCMSCWCWSCSRMNHGANFPSPSPLRWDYSLLDRITDLRPSFARCKWGTGIFPSHACRRTFVPFGRASLPSSDRVLAPDNVLTLSGSATATNSWRSHGRGLRGFLLCQPLCNLKPGAKWTLFT